MDDTITKTEAQELLEEIMSDFGPHFEQIGEVENDTAVYGLYFQFHEITELQGKLEKDGWLLEIKEEEGPDTKRFQKMTIILEVPQIFSKEEIQMAKPSKINPEKQEKLVNGFLLLLKKNGLQPFVGNGKVMGNKYSTQVDITKPISQWPSIARFVFSNDQTRKVTLENILNSRQGRGVVFLTDNRNNEPSILLILNEKCQNFAYALVRKKTDSIKDVLTKNKIEIVGNFQKVSIHDLGIKVITLKNPKQVDLAVKCIGEQTKFTARASREVVGEIIVSGLTHNIYHENSVDFQKCCDENKIPSLYNEVSLPTKEDIIGLLKKGDYSDDSSYPKIKKDTGELVVVFEDTEIAKRQSFYESFTRMGIKCHLNESTSLFVTIVGTIPESERVVEQKTEPVQKQTEIIPKVLAEKPNFERIVTLLKTAFVGLGVGITIINNGEKIKIQVNGDKKKSEMMNIANDVLVSEQFNVVNSLRGTTLFYIVYDEAKVINNEYAKVESVDTFRKDEMLEIVDFLKSEIKSMNLHKNVRLIGLTENEEKIKIQVRNHDVGEFRKIVEGVLVSKKYKTSDPAKGGKTIVYIVYDENKIVETKTVTPAPETPKAEQQQNASSSNDQEVPKVEITTSKQAFELFKKLFAEESAKILFESAKEGIFTGLVSEIEKALSENEVILVKKSDSDHVIVKLHGVEIPIPIVDIKGVSTLDEFIKLK